MGFYKVHSATILGLKVEFVQVEADAGNGLPMFHMVGYLSSEVKEAAERVRTAMRNAGYIMAGEKDCNQSVAGMCPARRDRYLIFQLQLQYSGQWGFSRKKQWRIFYLQESSDWMESCSR